MIQQRTFGVGLCCLLAAALGACAYAPPKPGVYLGYGNQPADISCTFEAPTGSTFVVKRCRRTADMAQDADNARSLADGFKTPVPDIR